MKTATIIITAIILFWIMCWIGGVTAGYILEPYYGGTTFHKIITLVFPR